MELIGVVNWPVFCKLACCQFFIIDYGVKRQPAQQSKGRTLQGMAII